MTDDGWAWTDAWIFVSVVIAGKVGRHRRSPDSRRPEGVRLADVLATAEHLKQALPTHQGIETAVRRLLGADLISVTDGWFQVTPAGEQVWRSRPRGGTTATVDSVHNILQRRHAPLRPTGWRLETTEHAAAILEHTGRFVPAQRRSVENSAATPHRSA
ncbi:hypothetical protein O7632_14860 [Solwaraspora sp. WMMD406]|uniref:hypothetical protein n=1 Tax=Solwaraspora sp. WMMD406 TaxID=3016095 RepID=UPI002417159F|nr:hypothetical protein [Solwaraspora sp. WMMD406]MDG4765365.1 hypothetical protein [Solwaraspora sp. WMMD406]